MSKEQNKLSGKPPSLVEMNYLLYGCADPDMDIPNPKYMDAPEIQFFRDKVNMRRKGTGKIVITSTPAETGNDAHEFYKLWAKGKQ